MVLDSDTPTLSRLCELLRSRGYLTFGAETAPVACKMVQRRHVDLVLTTIALSDAERRAWTAAIGRLDVNVPVIAMCEASSAHALDLFDAANAFGATAVLRRPFTALTLLQMLTDLLPVSTQVSAAAAEPLSRRFDWAGLVSGSTAIH